MIRLARRFVLCCLLSPVFCLLGSDGTSPEAARFEEELDREWERLWNQGESLEAIEKAIVRMREDRRAKIERERRAEERGAAVPRRPKPPAPIRPDPFEELIEHGRGKIDSCEAPPPFPIFKEGLLRWFRERTDPLRDRWREAQEATDEPAKKSIAAEAILMTYPREEFLAAWCQRHKIDPAKTREVMTRWVDPFLAADIAALGSRKGRGEQTRGFMKNWRRCLEAREGTGKPKPDVEGLRDLVGHSILRLAPPPDQETDWLYRSGMDAGRFREWLLNQLGCSTLRQIAQSGSSDKAKQHLDARCEECGRAGNDDRPALPRILGRLVKKQ